MHLTLAQHPSLAAGTGATAAALVHLLRAQQLSLAATGTAATALVHLPLAQHPPSAAGMGAAGAIAWLHLLLLQQPLSTAGMGAAVATALLHLPLLQQPPSAAGMGAAVTTALVHLPLLQQLSLADGASWTEAHLPLAQQLPLARASGALLQLPLLPQSPWAAARPTQSACPERILCLSSRRLLAMTARAVPTSTRTAAHSVNLPTPARVRATTCAQGPWRLRTRTLG